MAWHLYWLLNVVHQYVQRPPNARGAAEAKTLGRLQHARESIHLDLKFSDYI
jgi:hypothetical protein